MKKYLVCIMIVSVIMIMSAAPVFSQANETSAKEEGQVPAQTSQAAAVQAPQAAPVQETPKTDELSIYGEVQAVNVQAGSMSVQYYDYDNDEEKMLEVTLDKDSKLENVKAISEVKKGDWVDVTYIAVNGKNTAKMVSVEKEELAAEENAPADTTEE